MTIDHVTSNDIIFDRLCCTPATFSENTDYASLHWSRVVVYLVDDRAVQWSKKRKLTCVIFENAANDKIKSWIKSKNKSVDICKLTSTICQVVSLRLGKYSPKVNEGKNVTKM